MHGARRDAKVSGHAYLPPRSSGATFGHGAVPELRSISLRQERAPADDSGSEARSKRRRASRALLWSSTTPLQIQPSAARHSRSPDDVYCKQPKSNTVRCHPRNVAAHATVAHGAADILKPPRAAPVSSSASGTWADLYSSSFVHPKLEFRIQPVLRLSARAAPRVAKGYPGGIAGALKGHRPDGSDATGLCAGNADNTLQWPSSRWR
jgi:hypothetical protein